MAAFPPDYPPQGEAVAGVAADFRPTSTGAEGATAPPASPAPAVPDHELLRCVGRGAYGAVWLARNVMGGYRAVKIVHREDFGRVRPFTREYEGLLKYEPISRSHPNLMQILHVGRHPDSFYYVTELADDAGARLKGEGRGQNGDASAPSTDLPDSSDLTGDACSYVPWTLQEDLDRRGRVSVRECVSVATALASALKHLHDHGLVHRDVKPSNVIFVHGVPKLADIGLVASAGDSRSIVGTEGYLPPEGPGHPPADLYSLGILLYEMSTGMNRREYPRLPENLREIPDAAALLEFNEILLRACAKDSGRRYHRAEELLADLALLERGDSVRRLRRLERHQRFLKRLVVSIAAAGLLLSVAWWQSWRGQRVANRHLAQLHVNTGVAHMVRGDFSEALPWLAGALQLEEGGSDLQRAGRLRLAGVLARCGLPVGHFERPESRVLSADLDAEGARLVTGHEDGEVWIWDTRSGDRVRSWALGFPVMVTQFLPNEDRLLTFSLEQKSRLWDLVHPDRSPTVLDQAMSANATQYSLGFNAALRRAYLSKGAHRFARTNGFEGPFENLTLHLAVVGRGDTGLVRYHIRRPAVEGAVLVEGEFADSPEADRLAEGGDTPAAPIRGRVWVMLEDACFGDGQEGGSRVVWDQVRMRSYRTGSRPPAWRVIDDFSSGKLAGWIHERSPANGHSSRVENSELVMSRERLSRGQRAGAGAVWREQFEVSADETLEVEADLVSARAPHPVVALSLCRFYLAPLPDEEPASAVCQRWLASSRWDARVTLWDLENGCPASVALNGQAEPLELAHQRFLVDLHLRPDGTHLVSVEADGRCSVWVLQTGARLAPAAVAALRVTGARFSADGRWLALSHEAGLLVLATKDWQLARVLGQGTSFARPTFSALGHRLAAVRDKHEVLVWDWGDPAGEPQVERHSFAVRRIAFSPDGRLLAVDTADNVVRLRDVVKGEARGAPLRGGLVRFSADGRQLLLYGEEGGVWLWNLTGLVRESMDLPPPAAASASRVSARNDTLSAVMDGRRITLSAQRTPTVLVHPWPVRRALFSSDHRYLVAETTDLRSWVWDLATRTLVLPPLPTRYEVALAGLPAPAFPSEDRNRSFLADLAALLGGQRFDGKGGMQPEDAASRSKMFRKLQQTHPREFGLDEASTRRWHRLEALQAEQDMAWDSALFHWTRLGEGENRGESEEGRREKAEGGARHGEEMPGRELAVRLAYARAAALVLESAILEGRSRWSVILPRPPGASPEMLDLGSLYTQALGEAVSVEHPADLFRDLPSGLQQLGGAGYDVRGIIDLRKAHRVTIPVGRPCRSIHFLHAASEETADNREWVATYRVRYADGATTAVRLMNPEDVRPFAPNRFHVFSAGTPSSTTPGWQAATVWVGNNPRLARDNRALYLTGSSWQLPETQSGQAVTVLELEAEPASSAPLVFAVSIE